MSDMDKHKHAKVINGLLKPVLKSVKEEPMLDQADELLSMVKYLEGIKFDITINHR
jgi:hypothetical protein